MPRRSRFFFKAFLPLGLLVVAAFALVRRAGDDWEYEQDDPETDEAPQVLTASRRRPAARFALAAGFTTLFFAGASFTAGAGDQMARLMDDDAAALAELSETASGDATATTEAEPAQDDAAAAAAAPAEAAPADAAPAAEPAQAMQAATPEAAAPQNEAAAAEAAIDAQAAHAEQASNVTAPATAAASSGAESPAPATAAKPSTPRPTTKQWVVQRAAATPAQAPEIELGEPTIWLNRALPDPTPASARLARSFARNLAAASTRRGADWAAVLGVLRAQGERGSVPATAAELDTLASRLAGENAWKGALAMSGRTSFADRASALADLYRSVGIEALVTGYQAAKARLTERLLADDRLWIYGSGRADLAAGRIDIRVIVLLGYLAERHGAVTISSLFSGHRKFARPGVVSAHIYGQAVDVAAIGGSAIAGNQQPGGLTEAAVRSVLLLPAELQPQQVISLLGLGGPSFPLRDHGDHIHIGF